MAEQTLPDFSVASFRTLPDFCVAFSLSVSPAVPCRAGVRTMVWVSPFSHAYTSIPRPPRRQHSPGRPGVGVGCDQVASHLRHRLRHLSIAADWRIYAHILCGARNRGS